MDILYANMVKQNCFAMSRLLIYVIILKILIAIMNMVIKLALSHKMSSYVFVVYRNLIGFLTMMPLANYFEWRYIYSFYVCICVYYFLLLEINIFWNLTNYFMCIPRIVKLYDGHITNCFMRITCSCPILTFRNGPDIPLYP